MSEKSIKHIVQAYDDLLIRLYSTGRFLIIRQRFLQEIGQYFPESGKVLDIGCGFGLFGLFYAKTKPLLQIHGVDLNPRRVAIAKETAQKLQLSNFSCEVADITAYQLSGTFQCMYMLDVVHHIPTQTVRAILERLYEHLQPGGLLLLKDITARPAYKVAFTYVLDKLMDPRTPVHYWSQSSLRSLLEQIGFSVVAHEMIDVLPYPHILYICRRPAET